MAETALPIDRHDSLDEKLGRLVKKAGVKATLALDRTTGVILKTSGDVAALKPASGGPAPAPPSFDGESLTPTAATFGESAAAAAAAAGTEEGEAAITQGVERFAAMVWRFVQISGTMVTDLDTEDELRLLRLRTKKQEIVIVPDPNYLLIVVHDTPPA